MTDKEVKQEINHLSNIKILVVAYEEIAASYMRRVRNNVVQKREFLDGIFLIFQQVKASYKAEIEKLLRKKKGKKTMSIKKGNGKKVLVFISANTGLYGDIVKKTYDLFMEEVKKGQTDITIIGRLGTVLFQGETENHPFTYFDFPDNRVDSDLLRKIILHLIEYEEIIVFYGKFQTVVNQIPIRSNIAGDEVLANKQEEASKTIIKYIFEPSLENILKFFESEIFASIFEQTVYESQLAKFASRMITLDKANENIKETLKKAYFTEQKIKHRTLNAKQLNSLSSFSLWGK